MYKFSSQINKQASQCSASCLWIHYRSRFDLQNCFTISCTMTAYKWSEGLIYWLNFIVLFWTYSDIVFLFHFSSPSLLSPVLEFLFNILHTHCHSLQNFQDFWRWLWHSFCHHRWKLTLFSPFIFQCHISSLPRYSSRLSHYLSMQ